MIKVDELKLVEALTAAMAEGAREAFSKEVVELNDVVIKNYFRQVVQENLLEIDDKDCEKLWDVVNFCFGAD